MSTPVGFGLARDVDVVVIGGGVVGVCSAWFLAQAGHDVVLLDKGAVCSGSSYGNAGLVVPSHCVPLAEPQAVSQGLRWMLRPDSPFYIKPRLDADLARWLWRFWRSATPARVAAAVPVLRDLQLASRSLYAQFADGGLDFGYGQRGSVHVCVTPEGFAAKRSESEHIRNAGLEVEELDAAGVATALGLEANCAGGIAYAQDAHLDPARFVRALAQRAQDAGVQVIESAEVLRLDCAQRRVTSVISTRGVFRARQVVLAAGAWSPALATALDLRVPIQAAKGYSIEIDAPNDAPDVPFMLKEARVGVTPLGRGRVRFAGTLELAGMDMSITQRRVEALIDAVPRYLPTWDPATFNVREVWRGLRPCTPDGLALLGRPRAWDNVVLAAGHAMIGLSMGPVTGQLVAQIVNGESPEQDLSLLDPDRFA